jgi:hypothetical protein
MDYDLPTPTTLPDSGMDGNLGLQFGEPIPLDWPEDNDIFSVGSMGLSREEQTASPPTDSSPTDHSGGGSGTSTGPAGAYGGGGGGGGGGDGAAKKKRVVGLDAATKKARRLEQNRIASVSIYSDPISSSERREESPSPPLNTTLSLWRWYP